MAEMKVVIVAPVHPYDDIRVFQKEARTLAIAGYDVVLIARSSSPLQLDGIQVIPVPSYVNRVSRFAHLLHLVILVIRQHGDIYHLHNPDTLPLAIMLRVFGCKVIYDTHEDFSKRILIREWMPRILRPLIAGFIACGEWLAGHICSAAIGTQTKVTKRLGKKSVLIENPPWSAGTIINEAYKYAQNIPVSSDFRLIYTGALINEYRGIFAMIDAINSVNQRFTARLWLAGIIADKDLAVAKNMSGWQFVDYLGLLPLSEAYAHIIRSDAGLLTIQDVADHRETSPNKLYEYQLFGIPYIASSFPHWKDQLSTVDSGLFVDPSDVDQISKAIVWLAENQNRRLQMGANGRNFICKYYNWENESKKLLNVYERILHPGIYSGSVQDKYAS